MGPPVAAPQAPDSSSTENPPTAPAAPAAPLEDQARAKLEQVFSPEVSAMLMHTAFGVASVVTGEPDIWQATDDEVDPLAPALGRQLARIPVIRMIGPDNTEGGVVLLGIGVMVTRRLNEHAERKQRRARGAAAAAETRGSALSEPTDLSRERDARLDRAAVPAEAVGEDGSRAAHFGIRA